MTALPGTPAIQNAIPMPFFGTTPFAAPGLGIITGTTMLILGWQWLEYRVQALGPGYGDHPDALGNADDASDKPSLLVAALHDSRNRTVPCGIQWLVSDLSLTLLSCPATICACHSGSRATDRIVSHWSQRNWRIGTVVSEFF